MAQLIQVRNFLVGLTLALAANTANASWETPGVATQQLAEQQALPAPGLTATVRDPFYKVTAKDVGDAVAEQLQLQAVESKAEVIMNPGTTPIIYSADHPVKVVIHALQIDNTSKRWQAQAYLVADGKTETVRPISGTYGALIEVPVVTRQFGRADVIEQADIKTTTIPERLMRKDTVTDPKQLIGQSPRSGISPNRPIRTSEITAPTIVKRGDLVEMHYSTPYIQIKTTGVALEDGAKGQLIRVKNQKSEHAVSGRVESAGRIAVNSGTL